MKKQCNGTVDECLECGKYYASHSAHFEKVKNVFREIMTINRYYGTGGTFDANIRERIESY